MKYYRLDKQEVVETITEIPQEQWERKQVLPYEINNVKLAENEETTLVEGLDIQADKVVDTKFERYHMPTLDELKETKYQEIKSTYNQLLQEGFICTNGIKLDCRESDKINWLSVKLCGGVLSTPLRDFNNVSHLQTELEPSIVLGMLDELENYYKELLSTKWEYKTLVNSYTTDTEVNAFYWRKAVMDELNIEVISYVYWGE